MTFCDFLYNKTLIYLNQQLNNCGNDLSNCPNMPKIRHIWQQIIFEPRNQLIADELNYNCEILKTELNHNLNLLNCEQ